jgi:hypothetical protein
MVAARKSDFTRTIRRRSKGIKTDDTGRHHVFFSAIFVWVACRRHSTRQIRHTQGSICICMRHARLQMEEERERERERECVCVYARATQVLQGSDCVHTHKKKKERETNIILNSHISTSCCSSPRDNGNVSSIVCAGVCGSSPLQSPALEAMPAPANPNKTTQTHGKSHNQRQKAKYV